MSGVTLEFYCAALNALVKRHGSRLLNANDGSAEQFRLALEKAEALYLTFDPVPKPKRKRKCKTKGGEA